MRDREKRDVYGPTRRKSERLHQNSSDSLTESVTSDDSTMHAKVFSVCKLQMRSWNVVKS